MVEVIIDRIVMVDGKSNTSVMANKIVGDSGAVLRSIDRVVKQFSEATLSQARKEFSEAGDKEAPLRKETHPSGKGTTPQCYKSGDRIKLTFGLTHEREYYVACHYLSDGKTLVAGLFSTISPGDWAGRLTEVRDRRRITEGDIRKMGNLPEDTIISKVG